MPAPNIMDPAQKCGLYNPHPSVRRMAVEAIGKFWGVQVMKKWEREEARAKARVQQYAARAPVPYAPVILTDEEQVAFDELIGAYQEEETAATEEDGGEGERNGSEEGKELAVGAATSEPGVGAAAVEMKGKKGSIADTATEGTLAKESTQTQKEEKEEKGKKKEKKEKKEKKKEVRYHCTKPFERVLTLSLHSKQRRHQEQPPGIYSVARSWIASGFNKLSISFRSAGPFRIKPFRDGY